MKQIRMGQTKAKAQTREPHEVNGGGIRMELEHENRRKLDLRGEEEPLISNGALTNQRVWSSNTRIEA